MARTLHGHPLCKHERPDETFERCDRFWCSWRFMIAIQAAGVLAIIVGCSIQPQSWDRVTKVPPARFAQCTEQGECNNDQGLHWRQPPGTAPQLDGSWP